MTNFDAQNEIQSVIKTFGFSYAEAVEWLKDRFTRELAEATMKLQELEAEEAESYSKRMADVLGY